MSIPVKQIKVTIDQNSIISKFFKKTGEMACSQDHWRLF